MAAISVTGGVSSNRRLERPSRRPADGWAWSVFFPLPDLRTDNAAMVAVAGAARLEGGEVSGLDLNAVASAPLESVSMSPRPSSSRSTPGPRRRDSS